MELLRLTRPVILDGRDYFGRRATIRFIPTGEGWHWLYKPHQSILISADIARWKKRRLSLIYGGSHLETYEHIGALRWLGLDGVVVESTAWPPFYGRVYELWEALKPFCKTKNKALRWRTIKKPVCCRYENRRGYTQINPSREPSLRVKIICDYPGLGSQQLDCCIPDLSACLREALKTYAQGWPPWLYHASGMLSKLGWPHHHHMVWPQEHSRKETIRLFALHRLVDLLGALSLADSQEFLAADVVSYCSGHWADLEAVKQARTLLCAL